MKLIEVINNEIIQEFNSNSKIVRLTNNIIMRPKLTLEEWATHNCYPVIRKEPNKYEIQDVIVWDTNLKKGIQGVLPNTSIDIELEKEELIDKYRIIAENKHIELNKQDFQDLRTLGYVSDDQKLLHNQVTNEYNQAKNQILLATNLDDLLIYANF